MCLYPRLIANPKYRATVKNGGEVPHMVDQRVGMVPIGCSNCMECRKKKSREWRVRLGEEIRHDSTGKFVTLSFSDESLVKLGDIVNNENVDKETGEILQLSGYNLDNAIVTKGMRRFLERWRKKTRKSVKHWFISELGEKRTERVHLHGILFTEISTEELERRWSYGNVWVGEFVNERTIGYIVKYLSKSDDVHREYKPKILTSSGIGKGWKNRIDSKNAKYIEGKTREHYKDRSGRKMALPIYYRNMIYSEEEREKLWIEKIDKKIRYVDGIKIDISEGEEIYWKRLTEKQEENKWLGFEGISKNWERKRYENERRNMKFLERKQKEYAKRYDPDGDLKKTK